MQAVLISRQFLQIVDLRLDSGCYHGSVYCVASQEGRSAFEGRLFAVEGASNHGAKPIVHSLLNNEVLVEPVDNRCPDSLTKPHASHSSAACAGC